MKLELHRVEEDESVLAGRENKRTRGNIFKDGDLFIDALEDEVRRDGVKIKGKSAIPAGEYMIRLTYSPKYGRIMPEICDVPSYSGIRIHSGHDERDTEGCLLTASGFDKGGDIIAGTSRPAAKKFEAAVVPALQRGETVSIVITNDFLRA